MTSRTPKLFYGFEENLHTRLLYIQARQNWGVLGEVVIKQTFKVYPSSLSYYVSYMQDGSCFVLILLPWFFVPKG